MVAVLRLLLAASLLHAVKPHSGHELPDGCDRPYVLCWSRRLKNSLEPGVLTLLLPPSGTHDLSCSKQAGAEFRASIAGVFAGDASRLLRSSVMQWVQENEEEIQSLASTYDLTFGALNPSSTGSRFISMNRTDCLMAYLSGKLLLPFAQAETSAAAIMAKLHDQRVFDQFWHLMLHWSDVQSTQWPVISLLEFLSAEVHREKGLQASEVPGSSMSHELRLALGERPGRRQPWALLASEVFSREPKSSLATASAYLAMALAIIERDDTGLQETPNHLGFQAQALVTRALNWMRSLSTRQEPLLEVLMSSWPVLALWGRLWRQPLSEELLAPRPEQGKWQCPASHDPIWQLRAAQASSLLKALPAGRWPLGTLMQGSPSSPRESAAKEAWATAISLSPDRGLASSAAQSRAWVEAVRVLHASVRLQERSGVKRPFIVAVDEQLDKDSAALLQADGMTLVVLEPLIVPDHLAKCGAVQRRAEGLRFRLFGLTEFERLIYIDADALAVGPLEHLFASPKGLFLSATINGTRWTMRDPLVPLGKPGSAAADRGPPGNPAMINTGVMVITPSREVMASFEEVVTYQHWQDDGRWAVCDERDQQKLVGRVCKAGGIFAAFCTQGLIDAVQLATTSRLGLAVWQHPSKSQLGEEFLGCEAAGSGGSAKLVMPQPHLQHCVLDEAYNLQATRPHLSWHTPFLASLDGKGSSIVRVVHWPGQPKPWRLGPGQRTEWERRWWDVYTTLGETSTDLFLRQCG